MATKISGSIQVIDRLAHLLDVLAEADGPVSLKVLANTTGLHPSTVFRILASANEHGFVERSETGHYRLGSKLLQLGSRVRGQIDLRREAKPIMDWLCREIAETVNLIVREGDEVVYVDCTTPSRMMKVEQTIGSHMPMHVTAVGKLFLAELGAEACLEYAERNPMQKCTIYSITEPAVLWQNIKDSFKKGYALDDQEAELGVGCIGVPIMNSDGTMVAGLSISAPFERRNDHWIAIAKTASRRLSARLGYYAKNP